MKVLIYFVSILAMSIIHTILLMTIRVASPLLETIAMFALARFLCRKWDERKSN